VKSLQTPSLPPLHRSSDKRRVGSTGGLGSAWRSPLLTLRASPGRERTTLFTALQEDGGGSMGRTTSSFSPFAAARLDALARGSFPRKKGKRQHPPSPPTFPFHGPACWESSGRSTPAPFFLSCSRRGHSADADPARDLEDLKALSLFPPPPLLHSSGGVERVESRRLSPLPSLSFRGQEMRQR